MSESHASSGLISSSSASRSAISCNPADGIGQRRRRSPWYRTKTTPAAADMHAALRDAITTARINAISPGHGKTPQITGSTLTSKTEAA